MEWEYLTVVLASLLNSHSRALLTELSREGWQLVSVMRDPHTRNAYYTAIFQRPALTG